MNFSNAVKELMSNPRADHIEFTQLSTGHTLSMILGPDNLLFFKNNHGGLGSKVRGSSADFVTREDFTVVYKKPKPFRMKHGVKCDVIRVTFSVPNFHAAMFLVRSLSLDESVTEPVMQYLQSYGKITVFITVNQFTSFNLCINRCGVNYTDAQKVTESDDSVFDLT